MIKDKDMADKIQMKKETGLVHIYTGDGKGKTTAAAGLALRAAGRGLKVIFAQFMKGRASGEVDALAQIPDVMVLRASKDYGFYSRMSEADRNMQKKEHDSILDTIFEHVYKKHDVSVVVLDELVELLRDNTVDGLVKSLVAIDLLYERRGNHSLAETLEVSVSPVSGESFLLLLGIVLRLQGDGQFDVKIIDLIFCYFHNSVNIILN